MSSEIIERIRWIIVNQLGVPESAVTPEASFADDLQASSLDKIELIMAFEEAFGLEIPDPASDSIATVQDAVNYIEARK